VKKLVAVLAVICAACGVSQDDEFRWTVEKNVAARLKDPRSAKFSGVYLIRQPAQQGYSKVAACGVVDGKNSFGTYAGSARFVAHGIQGNNMIDITSIQIEDPSDRRATIQSRENGKLTTIFEEVYWNAYCVDDNHPSTHTASLE
jgi:hypothetical protein